jgi:hypothetical protein
MQSAGAQPLHIRSIATMWVHFMGEELKKHMPNLVFEIEQERVKYLTLIHNQLHNQFYNQFNV